MAGTTTDHHINHLRSLVSTDELILPSHTAYTDLTTTWAAQKNLRPKIIVRPFSASALSAVLAYLSQTDLDIAIHGSGYGSASARDVLVSMAAFDAFEFDRDAKVVTLGAGQTWREYYDKMERVGSGYHVVAARTPALSIGGSVLSAGFSWLARQYGNTSDASNLLDAECVMPDGQILWASEDPDLLWALRGGGGSFCAVTSLKLRAYPCPRNIFAGSIIVQRTQLSKLAKGIAEMQVRAEQELVAPQVAMDLYVVRKEQAAHMGATEDLLIVQVFDALGEEHGRSAEGFKWALDIPGAMDLTKVTDLKGVSQMHEQVCALKGVFKTNWQPMTLGTLSETNILNAVEWFDRVGAAGGTVANSVQLVFECLCTRDADASKTSNEPSTALSSSAWPRPKGMVNTTICAAGCAADGSGTDEEFETARQLVMEAPGVILSSGQLSELGGVRTAPNAVEPYHDLNMVFAANLPTLRALKTKYDPRKKLKGPI